MKQILIKLKSNKKFWAIGALPVALIVNVICMLLPGFSEWYARTIFLNLSKVMSNIVGVLPFSLMEVLVIAGILWAILLIVKRIIKIFLFLRKRGENKSIGENSLRKHEGKKITVILKEKKKVILSALGKFILNLLAAASIAYAVYVPIWGVNFYRKDLADIIGYDVSPATESELAGLCGKLIEMGNEARSMVQEDERGCMMLNIGINDTIKRADAGYANLGEKIPVLKGNFGKTKKVFFSDVMSYLRILGIYFPYTFEANINKNAQPMEIPASICHEMAHQRGFAKENEASFIAFLVCLEHPDVDYRYSGIAEALQYSMSKLRKYNKNRYEELLSTYSEGMLRDEGIAYEYWQEYDTPIGQVAEAINDTYLKANQQEEGTRSYGMMVDLLIAWYRNAGNGQGVGQELK